ncbi:hypothetical protein [Cysteiniphilum marinum]|uniref:hypothetical protein n=1 Tax=Cysteiniphilum marinum TaxID=2774191 RepID=UPI00193A7936|nr:hypothetical protein [Cysteiniphilum marinum]
MANQYSESFKAVVEAKYNMPIAEVLRRFQCQGVSLKEAAQKTGFRETTVKKHALRHKCRLIGTYKTKEDHCNIGLNELYTALRSDRLNRVNVLSRSWQPKKRA